MSIKLNTHYIEQDIINSKQYASISFEQRVQFLNDVLKNRIPLRQAAITNKIKLSTAKVILKLYKEKGRVGKIRIPQFEKADKESKQDEKQLFTQETHNNELDQYYHQVCVELGYKLNYLKQINSQLEKALRGYSPVNWYQTNNINY